MRLAAPGVAVRRALMVLGAALPLVVLAGFLGGTPGAVWWEAAGWVLAGAAYGIAALALLHAHLRPRQVDARRAAAHAAVFAALCGTAAGLGVAFGLPHGYWYRPQPRIHAAPCGQGIGPKSRRADNGTLLGVLIPNTLVYFLPSAALIPIAALSTLALVSYLFAAEYTREAVFMTVTPVIVPSGGVKANAIAVGEIRLALDGRRWLPGQPQRACGGSSAAGRNESAGGPAGQRCGPGGVVLDRLLAGHCIPFRSGQGGSSQAR